MRHRMMVWVATGVTAVWTLGGASIGSAAEGGTSEKTGMQLPELEQRIDALPGKLQSASGGALTAERLQSQYKAETRYNDAQVAYLLGDYSRAATLFADVVNREALQGLTTQRMALYFLADSLIHLENVPLAHIYLKRLVKMGPGEMEKEGAELYLTSAIEWGQYKELQSFAVELSNLIKGNEHLNLYLGLAYFNANNYKKAIEVLEPLSNPASLEKKGGKGADAERKHKERVTRFFKATYTLGAAEVAEGKLDKAAETFMRIIHAEGHAHEHEDVRLLDLARLGMGRLSYAADRYNEAVNWYGEVSGEEELIATALWELTWVYIAQENYVAARQNLEVLLLRESPYRVKMQARTMQADILLRLREYQAAFEAYEEITKQYSPAVEDMRSFAASHGDPEAFFKELVQDTTKGVSVSFMAPIVYRYLDTNRIGALVSRLSDQVHYLREEISESERLISEIETVVTSKAQIQSFPLLAKGWVEVVNNEYEWLSLTDGLVTLQASQVVGQLETPAERKEWDRIAENLNNSRQAVRRTTGVPGARMGMRKELLDEYKSQQREVERLGALITMQEEDLEAAVQYLNSGEGMRDLPTEIRQMAVLWQRNESKEIEETKKRQVALRRQVMLATSLVGERDTIDQAEAGLRENYTKELLGAYSWLKEHRGSGEWSRFDRSHEKLLNIKGEIGKFTGEIDRILGKEVVTLKKEIQAEKEELLKEKQLLETELGGVSEHAGVLSYINFLQVQREIEELKMRGEVGKTDVAWQKKDDASTDIRKLFKEKTDLMKELQTVFAELR